MQDTTVNTELTPCNVSFEAMLFTKSVPAVLSAKLERKQQDLPSASLNALTAKPRRPCTLRSTGGSARQNCALHPWGSGGIAD